MKLKYDVNEQLFINFARVAAGVVALICMATFWGFGIDRIDLRRWFDLGNPMRMNTAIGLFCASVALILSTIRSHGWLARLLSVGQYLAAAVTLVIGIVTAIEYVLRLDLGFDQIVVADAALPLGHPGRPSFEASIALTMLGLTLLLNDFGERLARRLSYSTSVVLVMLPSLSFLSILFGTDPVYGIILPDINAVGLAYNTSISLLLLSFALFFRRPDRSLPALFVSETSGGIMARRLLQATIMLPLFILIFRELVKGVLNLDDFRADALAASLCLGALIAFTWLTAQKLDRADRSRMEGEAALRTNEKLLSTVLETVPVGIWITDESGRIVRGNPAGRKIWEGSRYVGIDNYGEYKGWWAETGQPIGARDWALARALERAEISIDETIKIQCFDGSMKVISNSAMPILDDRQQVIGAIVTNYDISQRYRLERGLALLAKAGEELMATSDLETTFQRIAQFNVDKLGDCCLVYFAGETGEPKKVAEACNQHASSLEFLNLAHKYQPSPDSPFGIAAVIKQGRSILKKEVDDDLRRAIARDEWHFERLKNVLFSYMIVPIISNREIIGAIACFNSSSGQVFSENDLTVAEAVGRLAGMSVQNARAEKQLRQAIQAREDSIAIVAHDLRNPLSVVVQSCQQILDKLCRDPLPVSLIQKFAQMALNSGKRMAEILSNQLDLAQLQAGMVVIQKKPEDINEIIEAAVDLMRPLADQSHVKLNFAVSKDLPLGLVDKVRLNQILLNLLGNAVKYTGAGGTVTVSSRLVDEAWVEIQVADTGSGIKAEDIPHLFERYWQARGARPGTGLGLYIVKGFVEAHGGTVRIDSKEGQGTTVSFTLPLVQEDETPLAYASYFPPKLDSAANPSIRSL